MKRRLIYLLLPFFIFGFIGCGNFVNGFDESPNSPTKVTPPLLLSAAELGLQTSYTSGIDRISSVLVLSVN